MDQMTHDGRNGLVSLRRAAPDDAEALLALIVSAFLARQRQYSVYRDARAVPYLRAQLGKDDFVLAESCGALAGYYHAQQQDQTYFLKFIAASPAARGIGSALLERFERSARALGCRALELDVLASQQQAMDWYAHRGFFSAESTILFRLPLSAIHPAEPLAVDSRERKQALAEEHACGFAVMPTVWQDRPLFLGLIAGEDCKLFCDAGKQLEELAGRIAGTLPGRSHLLGSCAALPERLAPLAASELSIRMRKELR